MPLRKRSILIIDTDAFLAGLYARRFEARNWGVRVAETVAEVDKLLSRKTPDAILLDVGMIEGGWELLARLRGEAKAASSALVVLTALGDRESILRAQAAGVDGYLLKGHFVPSEVEEKIERLVAERREQR